MAISMSIQQEDSWEMLSFMKSELEPVKFVDWSLEDNSSKTTPKQDTVYVNYTIALNVIIFKTSSKQTCF